MARKKDRRRFPEGADLEAIPFEFEALDFPATHRKCNAYLADFRAVAPGKLRLHQHTGVKFVPVLQERLALKVGTDQQLLDRGHSRYFDSLLPHGYVRVGTPPAAQS